MRCLEKQTIRDKVDFIWIEWTDKPNPIVLKYPFIKVCCLNQKKDRKVFPSYDTGLQWNVGLFLAKTRWVTYFHCDIIKRDQLEVIANKIKQNENITKNQKIWFEGYEINHKGRTHPKQKKEIKNLIESYGEDFDLLPYEYEGKFKDPSKDSQGLHTVRKEDMINLVDGWYWNHTPRTERWEGPGTPQKKLGSNGVRNWLLKRGLVSKDQDDMRMFVYPHDVEWMRFIDAEKLEDREKYGCVIRGYKPAYNQWLRSKDPKTKLECKGGMKYYSDLVRDWLPQHEISYPYNPPNKAEE